MPARNDAMPGNPRYQPAQLVPYFGHDAFASFLVRVELAGIDTLADMGIIPSGDYALLTPGIRCALLSITTTEMDERERKVTKHDIRALVQLMQERLPEPLRRWVHVPFTSYDVVDTARALMYREAYTKEVLPTIICLIDVLTPQAQRHANMRQIGRTHGQHALPITVGFWLATILHRIAANALDLHERVGELRGKISGAVGAKNAQVALGIAGGGSGDTFEGLVLGKLGLLPAPISTQIVPPESLVRMLHACVLLSGALAQFGEDGRNLMRSEIGELFEPFEDGQVGSSTMAHKRNPINFENVAGTHKKTTAEYLKVLMCLTSDHQRDLVGSSIVRDFPIIIINLMHQLNTLLRADARGVRFLARLRVDPDACLHNLSTAGDSILAEPLYIGLQMKGYGGDAHHLVNHRCIPLMRRENLTLGAAMERLAEEDENLRAAWEALPRNLVDLFSDPSGYTGNAAEQTHAVCAVAKEAAHKLRQHYYTHRRISS